MYLAGGKSYIYLFCNSSLLIVINRNVPPISRAGNGSLGEKMGGFKFCRRVSSFQEAPVDFPRVHCLFLLKTLINYISTPNTSKLAIILSKPLLNYLSYLTYHPQLLNRIKPQSPSSPARLKSLIVPS